jgi:hypothetical protein
MKLTKQQLKQFIKEELKTLSEAHDHGPYPQTPEQLKDWTSGHIGDPNDPLPSTLAKSGADLDAAKTMADAMGADELELLQQHISDILAEPSAPSTDVGNDDDSDRLHLQTPSEADMRRLQRTGAGTVPRYRPKRGN